MYKINDDGGGGGGGSDDDKAHTSGIGLPVYSVHQRANR